jgi:hypothetical protein
LDNYFELGFVKYNFCLFFYRCFGGEVIEGYGMTETSCIVTAMDIGDTSIGHVGSPISSCGKLCFFLFQEYFAISFLSNNINMH